MGKLYHDFCQLLISVMQIIPFLVLIVTDYSIFNSSWRMVRALAMTHTTNDLAAFDFRQQVAHARNVADASPTCPLVIVDLFIIPLDEIQLASGVSS